MSALTKQDITCKKSKPDADVLICNTTIELAQRCDTPIILNGNENDLLAKIIDRSSACLNLFIKYAVNPVYSPYSNRDAKPAKVSDNLLVVHAFTGCDIVSALFSVCKRSALKLLEKHDCN